ncbi:hypothetical protein SAMN05216296_1085 [Pseudomonas pohangensis]|uniref:Uncharacterized protein n=1 Tax=Pseudomonas pohangensis TaxID=364197 RepID=A0A1H2EUB9_9PSED|nr:hypothetical protein [Pseudomonas pohangensis]SDT98700.1 hypothetical protein SAMN05216296_1085 [Pseudomonas pohangensis]
MFVGHYCAAFVAKRIEPRLPLWTLLLAVQVVDVFWGLFILLGIERASLDPGLPGNPLVLSFMPYTHSLPATLLWSAAAGVLGVALWARGEHKLKLGLTLAAAVASHWLLDLLVHRHDLGLWGDAHKVGLGLWDLPMAAYALEILLLAGSVLLLAFSPVWPGSRRRALAVLCLGLLVLQTASQFGATPGNLKAMVVSALAVYLLVPLAGRWAEGK